MTDAPMPRCLQPGLAVDRYTLRVLVSSSGRGGLLDTIELWQAYDPILDRSVAIRMVPSLHPRAAAAAEAARLAATVDERSVVAVLDVLENVEVSVQTPDAQITAPYTVLVHEWTEGRTLTDLLEDRQGEALPPDAATHLVRQVAGALAAAHRNGVSHGRIRPGSLIMTGAAASGDEAQVRIRGLGIDASLWGATEVSPGIDPDVHGVGCLLYAAITARWPDGLADGISRAPRHDGRLLAPTAVVAEVPRWIDEVCARSIDPQVWGSATSVSDSPPYADMDALLLALGTPLESADTTRRLSLPSAPSVPRPTRRPGRTRSLARRAAGAALAIAVVGGLAFVGLRIFDSAPSPWGEASAPIPTGVLTEVGDPGASGSITDFQTGVLPGQIVPVGAESFDPYGTGSENEDQVQFAIDRDPLTAWTTNSYASPELAEAWNGKPGVGIVVDLGSPRAVSAVRLDLVGSGSSVEVRVGSSPDADPDLWPRLAIADSVGDTIDLRSPRPVVGQYVLVWFTKVPPADSGYAGGVREIAILSN
jgi:putative peptidoglycan lipid II flippase